MSKRESFPAEDVIGLLTDKQWKKLALWQYYEGYNIKETLSKLNAIWDGNNEQTVNLEGMLPMGLYGVILPDGSSHT